MRCDLLVLGVIFFAALLGSYFSYKRGYENGLQETYNETLPIIENNNKTMVEAKQVIKNQMVEIEKLRMNLEQCRKMRTEP